MKKIYLLFLTVLFATFMQAQTNISNYTFSTTTGATYTPITGGTVAFAAGYDNGVTAAITMGGTFPFGGVNQTTCFINTNGYINFGAASSTSSYTPMSTLGSTTGAIAAFAQDAGTTLAASPNAEIRYQNLGTEFVVQYKDHANYFNLTTEKLNFQIRLTYATGAVNIVYGSCTAPGTSTSGTAPQVGIRGNSVTWASNVNSLLIGNVPAATTCDWSTAISSNANSSAMLFSPSNTSVVIPSGLKYTWTPPVNTLAPVRTFAAVASITSSSAILSWTAPTLATSYNIRYRIPGSCSWTSFSGNPVAATTASITSLTSATSYQIQVQASDGTNNSIWSNIPTSAAGSGLNGYTATGTFTTLANVCTGTPTAGTVAPALQNVCPTTTPAALILTGFSTGVTGITFQWEQATDVAFTTPANAVGGTGATTATYTPPSFAGTNIYYRCRVTCTGSALSATSNVSSVLTPAAPATQASALAFIPLSTTATINWTSGNGGRRYVVVNTVNSFTDPSGTADVTGVSATYTSGEKIVYDGTASTVSITGLTQGTTYFVRVYEYLRCTGAPNVNYYNVNSATNNPSSFTTLIPPVNDAICGALNLIVDDPTPVCTNTTAATYTAGQEPDISATCSTPNNTVWYKFTPTVSGVHSIIGSVPAASLDGMATWIYTYTATGSCPGALTLTAAGGVACVGAPNSPTAGSTTTVFTTALTAGITYYIYVDGQSGDFGDMCLRVVGPQTMTYISSTTTQPTTTTVSAGALNQNIVRLEVTVNGSISPLSISQVDFNTNGTTLPADISNAKVFYTGTSTIFSTTTPFGAATSNPSGSFSAVGSQALTGGFTNTTNYFWLVYDIACAAANPNVIDAECTGFNIGTAQIPTVTAPIGNRTITSFVSPTIATNQPSTATVSPGVVNSQVLRVDVPASFCLGTITQLNFTNPSTNLADIVNAKVFYTTTTTFSNAIQFGNTVVSPVATFNVAGSQLSTTSGTNYFWLVYDINCSATLTNVVDAGCSNVVAALGSFTPATPNPTGTRAIAAATSFTTVANGEWSNAATWACGAIPLTNATDVTIAHNISVSDAGNIGGSVTINSGSSLTVNAGGGLTLGTVGGGNRILSNSGTLAVNGGVLSQNGSISNSLGSTFNQSGGAIIIDGNAGGVVANSVASGTAMLQFFQVNSAINLTGGTLTIVDPHVATVSSNVIGVDNITTGTQTSTINHTLILGDGVSTDVGGNVNGFRIDPWTGSAYLSFGNIIINGGNSGVNRVVTCPYQLAAVGDVTINANSTLNLTSSLVVGKNFEVKNSGTFINPTSASSGLAMALIGSNSGTSLTFAPSTNAQNITNNGAINNLASSPTANLNLFTVSNSSAAGVTLSSPIGVSGTIGMLSGVINTDNTNLLTLGYNTTNVGTLTYIAGRINGPFKRWISTTVGARQFPVGTATLLEDANINYTVVPTAGGSLTARWLVGAPGFTNVSALNEGALIVSKVSNVGQWQIDAGDGLAGGTYTGVFKAVGCTDVVDFSKMVLVKRPSTGGDWTLDGTHVTTIGTNAVPTLQRTGMSGFSQFAIGGENNIALPLSIEYFKGYKQSTTNTLDWKISCTSASTVTLTLERSANGNNFKAMNEQTVPVARCLQGFSYSDVSPLAGANYYRLKITSPDGQFRYSTIVVLLNKANGFELISVAPNPVQDKAMLTLTSAKAGKVEITVSDVAGKIVAKQVATVIAGNNPIQLNFATLGAGTYTISAQNADGEIKNTRFVKF